MSSTAVVCFELFPASYLLALAPSTAANAEAELAAHLSRACHSGKPAVWVDCRLLETLSATAVWLLWACQQRLRRRQARLVLCQVPTTVEHTLQHTLSCTTDRLLIVPTLDDAAVLAQAG